MFEYKVTDQSKIVIKAQREEDSSTEVTDVVEIFQRKIPKPYNFDAVDRKGGDEDSSS